MGMGASSMGAVLQATSAWAEASNRRTSLDYQATVARSNAGVAQVRASQTLEAGQIQEENVDFRTGALFGQQRAQLAANGVDLGSGSAQDVLTTTKFMGARDAAQVKTNAMREAWGYNLQAQYSMNQAQMYDVMKGGIHPEVAVLGSLLGSASQVAHNWDTRANATGGPDARTALSNWWSNLWTPKLTTGDFSRMDRTDGGQ